MPKVKKPEVIEGGPPGRPEHGAVYEEPENEEQEIEQEEEEQEEEAPDPVEALRAQLEDQSREIKQLNDRLLVRDQPPPTPEEPDNFYDGVEEKLFHDPRAVLTGMEDRIVDKVTKAMSTSYRKDQGEKDFWNEFYQKNPDLKTDDDLVKATLNGNLKDLGGMPVAKATERLAELTRDRIARYAKTPRKDRPKVEGARPPSPMPRKPEDNKVVTLSDIIKNRRAKRMGGAAQGA